MIANERLAACESFFLSNVSEEHACMLYAIVHQITSSESSRARLRRLRRLGLVPVL